MSKQGILITVADDQEGANPRIVTVDDLFPVQITDQNGENVVDQYSGSLRTIEQEHAEIHEGHGYNLSGELPSLAAGASLYIHIDPVAAVHWRYYKFTADGGPFDVELFKNPTIDVQGTSQLTPVNRNDLSSNVSSTLIYTDTTFTADGSRLDIDRAYASGTGVHAASEIEGLAVEWVINGGNTYALKVTNNDTNAIVLTYRFFWYEH